MKIKIIENGPYVVTGNIPLFKKTIICEGKVHSLRLDRKIETPDGEYALCRCGKSKNNPFCDDSHVEAGFRGVEIADMAPYSARASLLAGQQIDLMDDDRCAFARFCHREHGSVWELVEYSDDPRFAGEAIAGAQACPTGRLVIHDKHGEPIETEYETSISVVEDPERSVSGGIFVTGWVELEGADGSKYERRNRMALCRCGKSHNTPFCDAQHVIRRYADNME